MTLSAILTASDGLVGTRTPQTHPNPSQAVLRPLEGAKMIETLMGAAAEIASNHEVNLHRPDRGAHKTAVREAATVPPRWRAFAECVLRRESGGVLHNRQSREDARNGSSSASGRWQFLSAWQHGGSFMVKDRLVRFGMPVEQAKDIRLHLADKPIHRWDGWYQDVLFNEVIHRGGWHHWHGGNGCNGKRP